MRLHPEDIRYWIGWFIAFIVWLIATRIWLVNPIINAIRGSK